MKLALPLPAVLTLLLASQAHSGPVAPNAPATTVRRAIVFEPNVGQYEPRIRYRASGAGLSLSMTDTAAELSFGAETGAARQIRITAVAASLRSRPAALDRLAGVVNHFEGADPSAWHAGVPTFGRVRYAAV